MSGTYVAWNGQPYPWPPPEGWYEGSDGRWWAPGSGPEPDRSMADIKATAKESDGAGLNATAEGSDAADLEAAAEESDIIERSDDTDEHHRDDPTSSDQSTIITKPAKRPLPGHTDSSASGAAENQTDSAAPAVAGADRAARTESAVEQPASGRSSNTLVLAAGAATLLLIGAGVVALFNRGDGSDTETSGLTQPTTTLADGDATTQTLTTQQVSTVESDVTPPPTTQPVQTSTIPLDAATSSDPPATDAEINIEFATTWRETLANRGIDTTELSDEDIIDFGKSFCVFAVVSADPEEFDTYRDRAQTGVAGALTEAQLTAAIDTAVTTFCPEDAERLGIAQ